MSGLSMDMQISRPVWILIGVAVVALLFSVVLIPVNRKIDGVADVLERTRVEYSQAMRLAGQYEELQSGQGNKKSVLLQEPLFTYVEKVTRSLKLTQRLDYVRPENRTREDGGTIEVVHVSFKGITQLEFVKFLYHIEVQKKEIFVKTISIKKDGNKNFNVQMTLQKRS